VPYGAPPILMIGGGGRTGAQATVP
jgi:hypothetical protein